MWAAGGGGGRCWRVMGRVTGCRLVVVGAEARGWVRRPGVGAVVVGRRPRVVGRCLRLAAGWGVGVCGVGAAWGGVGRREAVGWATGRCQVLLVGCVRARRVVRFSASRGVGVGGGCRGVWL